MIEHDFINVGISSGDQLYTKAHDYYNHVAATAPRNEDGTFVFGDKILSNLFLLMPYNNTRYQSTSTIYIEPVDPSHVTIDNWLINCDEPFHVHPEFGIIDDFMESGRVIATVVNKKCILCRAEFKGELDMINKFYNMP